jgi:DNA polymerase III delta prime subunit
MGNEESLIKVIATTFCSYILKYFGINMMYFPIIQESLINILKNLFEFDYSKIIDFIKDIHISYNYFIYILLIGASGLLYYFRSYLKIDFDEKLESYNLVTYDRNDMITFLRFMDNFPDKFSKIKNYVNGDTNVSANKLQKQTEIYWTGLFDRDYPEPGTKININDEENNINGYVIWNKTIKEIVVPTKFKDDEATTSTKRLIPIPYCKFVFLFKKGEVGITIRKYFKIMQKANDEKLSRNRKITLFHYPLMFKVSERESIHSCFYDGKKLSIEERQKKYIDTFFHPMKKELWTVLKKINYNPEFFTDLGQSPRMGIIAHGPPGTGKSSFAYRIAMALERNIFSLNLKNIKNKKELFKIMQSPKSHCGVSFKPKNVVYIFDEFDYGIKYLYNKQIKRQKEMKKLEMITAQKYLNNKHETSDQNRSATPPPPTKKSQTDDLKDFDMLMTNELSLTDLLDIFQGAVPIDGLICVATTNDLETIKKLSPALVRHGRLTPIYFGYPNYKTLQDISMHYFNKFMEFDIDDNTILEYPTSKIIDIALQCKINESEGFELFKNKIDEIL